jgi:hypothetical protein
VILSNYKFYENRPWEGCTLVVSILQNTLCDVKPVDTLDRKERFGAAYDYLLPYAMYSLHFCYSEVKDKPR